MPGVEGVIEIITEYTKDVGLYDDYIENVKAEALTDRYQESFEFISNWAERNAPNEIIKKAVLQSFDTSAETWFLPEAIRDLCDFINQDNSNVKTILTTNFDPLIEFGLKKLGRATASHLLDSDGNLGATHYSDEKTIDIVHLHGYWADANTLHTQTQLKSPRKMLRASLKRLLGESTILVIAYGGWDDVFIEALEQVTSDTQIDVDILWGFYNSDSDSILINNIKLLNMVEPFKIRNSFRAYSGVDCKTIFKELLAVKKTQPIEPVFNKEKNNHFLSVLERSIVGESRALGLGIKRSPLKFNRAHSRIRKVEQDRLSRWSKQYNIITISPSLGMGVEGFIAEVILDGEASLNTECFRLNLDGVLDDDGFQEAFLRDLSCNMQVFSKYVSELKNKSILLIENFDNDFLLQCVIERVRAISDFCKNLLIIISGSSKLNGLYLQHIEMYPLDENDVRLYIEDHEYGDDNYIQGKFLNKIIELTNSLPERLDAILEKINYLGFNEAINDEEFHSTDVVVAMPMSMRIKLDEIINHDSSGLIGCYQVLKALCFMPYGESVSNLKKLYTSISFDYETIRQLTIDGFIYQEYQLVSFAELPNLNSQLYFINPIVRTYVINGFSVSEICDVLENSMDLFFGNRWYAGAFKLNPIIRDRIKNDKKGGSSNPQYIISSYLKYSLSSQVKRKTLRIFNASLFYVKFLLDSSRYRDAILSSEAFLSVAEFYGHGLSFNRLYLSASEGYRMLGNRTVSIKLMQYVFDNPEGLSHTELAGAHLEVAYAYELLNNENLAVQHAKNSLALSKKDGLFSIEGQSILIRFSATAIDERKRKYRLLESKARKNGRVHAANNLALRMVRLVDSSDEKIKILDKVISSQNDEYTEMRALISKASILMKNDKLSVLSPLEEKSLYGFYSYLFTQRIISLFDKVHDILWCIFKKANDINSLAVLFNHSSFIWRLNGEVLKEIKYSNELKEFLSNKTLSVTLIYIRDLANVRINELTKPDNE